MMLPMRFPLEVQAQEETIQLVLQQRDLSFPFLVDPLLCEEPKTLWAELDNATPPQNGYFHSCRNTTLRKQRIMAPPAERLLKLNENSAGDSKSGIDKQLYIYSWSNNCLVLQNKRWAITILYLKLPYSSVVCEPIRRRTTMLAGVVVLKERSCAGCQRNVRLFMCCAFPYPCMERKRKGNNFVESPGLQCIQCVDSTRLAQRWTYTSTRYSKQRARNTFGFPIRIRIVPLQAPTGIRKPFIYCSRTWLSVGKLIASTGDWQ